MLIAFWARLASVVGSGPVVMRHPSSAHPMAKVGSKSKARRRSSKARFHAMGLKTPPWGAPLLRYLLILLAPKVIVHDLF